MDWNWFFSSLAQSIAAVAGIVAAFAITSLVSNQADFKRQVARGEELLARCRELVDKLSKRYFRWYNERRLESALDSIEDSVRRSVTASEDIEELFRKYPSSPFLPRGEVIAAMERRIAFVRADRDRPRTGFDSRLDTSVRSMKSINVQPRLETEREMIDALVVDVRQNTRLVSQYLASLRDNPEDSPIVRLAIAASVVLFLGVLFIH